MTDEDRAFLKEITAETGAFLTGTPRTIPSATGGMAGNNIGPVVPEKPLNFGDAAGTGVDKSLQNIHLRENEIPNLYEDYLTREWQKFRGNLDNNEFAQYNTDLARGSRFPNVNDRTSAETLRYQRLVDALNNQIYTMPIQAGFRMYGSNGAQYGSEPVFPTEYKQFPKVETEETRAQDRARKYEESVRNQDILRQGRYLDYDINLKEKWLEELIRVRGKMSDEEIRRASAYYDYEVWLDRMKNDYMYRKDYQNFQDWLKNNVKTFNANVIEEIARNPKYGVAVAQSIASLLIGGSVVIPDEQIRAISRLMAEMYTNANITNMPTDEFARQIALVKPSIGADQMISIMTMMAEKFATQGVPAVREILQTMMGITSDVTVGS